MNVECTPATACTLISAGKERVRTSSESLRSTSDCDVVADACPRSRIKTVSTLLYRFFLAEAGLHPFAFVHACMRVQRPQSPARVRFHKRVHAHPERRHDCARARKVSAYRDSCKYEWSARSSPLFFRIFLCCSFFLLVLQLCFSLLYIYACI